MMKGSDIGNVSYTYSETVLQGRIISQDPNPGGKVETDTLVNIVLGKGPVPREVQVPNFTGKKT